MRLDAVLMRLDAGLTRLGGWSTGARVRARLRALDPDRDAHEVARLSLVTLHGRPRLVYALFTVAFLEQVAVPAMARTLHRRGTGDIVTDTLKRNDDTLVFFGTLLDHGPDSATGRAWIERLNEIHAHFPLREQDSLYTLSTLALDPEAITTALGTTLFTPAELEAQWRFWRAVAVRQHVADIPTTRDGLRAWARRYEAAELAPSEDGRAVAAALVRAFGLRCLPGPLRRLDARVVSAFCPPRLREVHGLPDPGRVVLTALGVVLRCYGATLPLHPVPVDRSLAVEHGEKRYGPRAPAEVGYQRGGAAAV